MNRPKLEDFYNPGKFYKVNELVPIYVNMIDALEDYCDELERALDEVCEDCNLLFIERDLCDEDCGRCNSEKRKNYIKQWCMKDEEQM